MQARGCSCFDGDHHKWRMCTGIYRGWWELHQLLNKQTSVCPYCVVDSVLHVCMKIKAESDGQGPDSILKMTPFSFIQLPLCLAYLMTCLCFSPVQTLYFTSWNNLMSCVYRHDRLFSKTTFLSVSDSFWIQYVYDLIFLIVMYVYILISNWAFKITLWFIFSIYSKTCPLCLTHWGRVTHIWFLELSNHWLK